MKWKDFLSDYFNFTRRERIALITIIALVFLIWLAPTIMARSSRPKQPIADTAWINAIKKLEDIKANEDENSHESNLNELAFEKTISKTSVTLFYFDPNNLPGGQWRQLGLHDKTIHTIQNYLSKGGHFYKPDDLKRIYGLHADEFEKLKPYIRIAGSKQEVAQIPDQIPRKEKNGDVSLRTIDINMADTTAFIALPGIGSKLAARIVNFREKLGGFYSADQIAETYGLADSTFQKIKSFLILKNAEIKKFNINTATKDEMKIHPYLKWNLANAIVEYRNQHGNYSSLEDLKKISLITDEIFNKIKPYLTL